MIVQVLKAAKIPILYHCTFSSDLALVPEARPARVIFVARLDRAAGLSRTIFAFG